MESLPEPIGCPRCHSRAFKKNGFTSNKKQSYLCRCCGRSFIQDSAKWHVTDQDKALIDKLLLEKISLNGICRVVSVSQTWLLTYLKELYSSLPDDLNAELSFGDSAEWLSDRMDEEIGRLEVVKKIRFHWKSTQV